MTSAGSNSPILTQYIQDVLELLLDDDIEEFQCGLLRKQLEFIEKLEYEYTTVGVFVSFSLSDSAQPYVVKNKNLRLGGVVIYSDELDISAEADVVVFEGKLDYLEIWSHGDIYPASDLQHYKLVQEWTGGKGREIRR